MPRFGPRARLLEVVPSADPTPAEQMLDQLASCRRRRFAFPAAWQTSWEAIDWPREAYERDGWQVALRATRPAWGAAYARDDSHAAATVAQLEGFGQLSSDAAA